MFNNLTIKSLLGRITPKKKAKYNKGLFHPGRDWRIILVSFILFVVSVSTFNVFFFWETKKVKEKESTDSTGTQTIDRTTLRSIITVFEEKRVFFEERKAVRPPALPDPTI
jgi:hypothetical protein